MEQNLMLDLPREILGQAVETDWLWWMRRVGYVLDSSLLWAEKADILLLNVYRAIPDDPKQATGRLQGVLDFYLCGDRGEPDEEPPREKLLDWRKDRLRIWGDFKVYAGIDLNTARMHWWEFMAIFNSLPPDSQIKHAIGLRALDLSELEDPKQREYYARAKRAIALEPVDYEAEYDAAMERRTCLGNWTNR